MHIPPQQTPSLVSDQPLLERRSLVRALTTLNFSGPGALAAVVLALGWAIIAAPEAYASLGDLGFSVQRWMANGLLTLFIVGVGIELKGEPGAGELRTQRTAHLPVIAALSCVVVSAAAYLLPTSAGGGSNGRAALMAISTVLAFAAVTLSFTHRPVALGGLLLLLPVGSGLGAMAVTTRSATNIIDLLTLGGTFVALAAIYALTLFQRTGGWWYATPGVSVWTLISTALTRELIARPQVNRIVRTEVPDMSGRFGSSVGRPSSKIAGAAPNPCAGPSRLAVGLPLLVGTVSHPAGAIPYDCVKFRGHLRETLAPLPA
ncbi:hypothetical protein GCM10010400_40470 [Streptomyces aculeolatus]|uniref:Na+/H+ antiporter NhaA n=1 Tax=Streptomyces aculeolatus TaxID=270689 RepID=UPI001CEC91BD|nr:Na+/H+ antiporter NhaA [Streptomyces aculeolatus]